LVAVGGSLAAVVQELQMSKWICVFWQFPKQPDRHPAQEAKLRKSGQTARQKLELQFEVELGAARRIGGNRLAEERRAEDADVGNEVGMVEDVERVERDGECRDVLLVFAMLR
jgi:hypothetical protein